jgi:hypothetical protein
MVSLPRLRNPGAGSLLVVDLLHALAHFLNRFARRPVYSAEYIVESNVDHFVFPQSFMIDMDVRGKLLSDRELLWESSAEGPESEISLLRKVVQRIQHPELPRPFQLAP